MQADTNAIFEKYSTESYTRRTALTAGSSLTNAQAAIIMLHGRGASAADILGLAAEIGRPGLAYFAPQAPNSSWYPNRFLAPLASNQPWLDAALEQVRQVVAVIAKGRLPNSRVFLLGFSQGASLALEYAARSGHTWGGVFGLSGALIGPPGSARAYPPGLAGTPVLLGCSDVDPYIPRPSVVESAKILSDLGAQVDTRIYPGLGHTIHPDEIEAIQAVLDQALGH